MEAVTPSKAAVKEEASEDGITGNTKNPNLRKMYIWLILGFVILLLMLQSFDFILFFVLTGFKLVAYVITGVLEIFAWIAYKVFNWKGCYSFFQSLSAYIDDLGFEAYGVVHSAI